MNRAELLLSVLRDGRPHTRRDIFDKAGEFFLTNNAASELRGAGYDIAHTREGRVDVYQLLPSQPSPLTPPPVSSFAGGGVSVILGGSSSGREEPPEPIPGQLSLDAA